MARIFINFDRFAHYLNKLLPFVERELHEFNDHDPSGTVELAAALDNGEITHIVIKLDSQKVSGYIGLSWEADSASRTWADNLPHYNGFDDYQADVFHTLWFFDYAIMEARWNVPFPGINWQDTQLASGLPPYLTDLTHAAGYRTWIAPEFR